MILMGERCAMALFLVIQIHSYAWSLLLLIIMEQTSAIIDAPSHQEFGDKKNKVVLWLKLILPLLDES